MNFNLYEWLNEPGMLMTKLRALTGDAKLKLIQEGFRVLNTCEVEAIGVDEPTQLFFIRESQILSNHDIAWHAKTYIPKDTYYQFESLFLKLKTQSLGEILYNNPLVSRVSLQSFTKNYPNIMLNTPHLAADQILGARASLFLLNEHYPLYLYEIFDKNLERAILK